MPYFSMAPMSGPTRTRAGLRLVPCWNGRFVCPNCNTRGRAKGGTDDRFLSSVSLPYVGGQSCPGVPSLGAPSGGDAGLLARISHRQGVGRRCKHEWFASHRPITHCRAANVAHALSVPGCPPAGHSCRRLLPTIDEKSGLAPPPLVGNRRRRPFCKHPHTGFRASELHRRCGNPPRPRIRKSRTPGQKFPGVPPQKPQRLPGPDGALRFRCPPETGSRGAGIIRAGSEETPSRCAAPDSSVSPLFYSCSFVFIRGPSLSER